MKLTKKQVYEFTRIYIGSYLVDTDKGDLWELQYTLGVDEESVKRIAEQIDFQGRKILGNRKKCGDAQELLELINSK